MTKVLNNEKKDASKEFIKSLVKLEFKSQDEILGIIRNSQWISKKYHEELITESKKLRILNGWYLYNIFAYVITHLIRVNIENRLRLFKKLNSEAQKWMH